MFCVLAHICVLELTILYFWFDLRRPVLLGSTSFSVPGMWLNYSTAGLSCNIFSLRSRNRISCSKIPRSQANTLRSAFLRRRPSLCSGQYILLHNLFLCWKCLVKTHLILFIKSQNLWSWSVFLTMNILGFAVCAVSHIRYTFCNLSTSFERSGTTQNLAADFCWLWTPESFWWKVYPP